MLLRELIAELQRFDANSEISVMHVSSHAEEKHFGIKSVWRDGGHLCIETYSKVKSPIEDIGV